MSFREDIVVLVCEQREKLPMLNAVLIAMGVLLAFSFLFLEPGTPSHALAVLDGIIIVVSLAFFSVVFWYCTKREMIEYDD